MPRSGTLRIGGLAPGKPFTVIALEGEAERLRREVTLTEGEMVVAVKPEDTASTTK